MLNFAGRRCLAGMIAFVSLSWASAARADVNVDIDEAVARAGKMSAGVLRRARRRVAIGPLVAGAGSFNPDSGELDGLVNFGLGLFYFDIPIMPDVSALIQERTRAVLKQRVEDMIARGVKPEKDDLVTIGREVYTQVRDEILGERNVRPRVLEKPRFGFVLEVGKQLRIDAWQTRLTFGLGVKSVTFGPTVLLLVGTDRPLVFLGPELAMKFLPGDGPRSPVVEAFTRMDFALADPNLSQFVLGVRLLIDII